MKKILLLVSLTLSLVYLGCGSKDSPDEPTETPAPSDVNPLGKSDTVVDPGDVDVGEVDPSKIQPCEQTTKQYASQEELVQAFEQANCVVSGNLDQACLDRYNYENCYKTKAPSPSSSSVVTCTRTGSDTELSFTFNTYGNLPGEGLLCDVIDYRGDMLFFAINQAGTCRSLWSSYKRGQGYSCTDDPPGAEPETSAAAPVPTRTEIDETEYFTITNQSGGVTVIVSLNEQSVNLAEDECVRLSAEDFNQISITTDADANVCSVGDCGEAGHYAVEARRGRFLWMGIVYKLIESSANLTCGNTLQ